MLAGDPVTWTYTVTNVGNYPLDNVVVVDDQHKAEMGIGSGIVYDSDASAEYDECLLKAQFLTHDVPSFALIETMLLEHGKIEYLETHLERLGDSARYFQQLLRFRKTLREGSR